MSRLRPWAALFLLLTAAAAWAAGPVQMSVQVKETSIRATPSFLAKVLAKLAYGDRVTVLSTNNGWARVTLPKGTGEGWVNLSALTEKQIVLKSGAENVSQTASSGEVALAGKGFNKEVESEYKQEKNLDYTWVDKMGKYSVTPDQIAAFLAQGGLAGLLGGAQ
jgi:uncharacterized protein YgiM (DUF1202 family)